MIEADLHAFAQMNRQELKAKWRSLFDGHPPSKISRKLMVQMISAQAQWNSSGLSKPRLMRRIDEALHADKSRAVDSIAPGTRLIREWHGSQHVVDVTPDGFVWQDRTWRSLSAIAREITGARWSGPRFFGVKGQG